MPDDNHDVSDENDKGAEPTSLERLRERAEGMSDEEAIRIARKAMSDIVDTAKRGIVQAVQFPKINITPPEMKQLSADMQRAEKELLAPHNTMADAIEKASFQSSQVMADFEAAMDEKRAEDARKEAVREAREAERVEREKRALELAEEGQRAAAESQAVAEKSRDYAKRSYVVAFLALIVAIVAIVVPLVIR
ncbi:hypothetical protein [Amycolatopsis sp. Poz14]|uniref:hypothetical protein n=1 Tax=Amycolatopsis sp. Poz14 TaxID=1447705 RepID=UPI001EE7CB63|nr:hypothetical protein [Amycolatopsis sp. Poz14]MCG3756680.1 hypothetical protein [Amycolatopsis sp. Poz14]